MNVNAGHERTSKARIIHQIQLIRGITQSLIIRFALWCINSPDGDIATRCFIKNSEYIKVLGTHCQE
ncbi:hypothetical protein [Shigella dysenteriae]|uniref:hypothetical protein n=1 Tax=Shigella dysenteriae TaxID=622 RepID=UPI001493543D|nr:hypothetical protein [Shigella dysenteriae]